MAISKIKDSNGNIHELSVDWSNVTNPPATVGYGTCSTLGNVAEKIVTISDTSWELKVGSIIGVKYSNTNTKPKVTLNVNGTGAKSIYYNTSEYLLANHYICGNQNRVIYYMYDGTYWVWISAGYLESDTDKKTSSSEKASTKLYLVGAQSQSSSGQTTYSNSKCYVGTDNCLYSNDTKVSVDGHTHYLSVTYSEILNLRSSGKLIPGHQYRITDYVTTTAQENTKSAGHRFDIIVTALNEHTLCEEAKAIQNDFDGGYFDDSNLEAWKIWYSIYNDTNRFKWANSYNYDSDNNLYEFNNWVDAVAKVIDDHGQADTFYEFEPNEKFSHFGYTEDLDGVVKPTLYGRNLDDDIDEGLNTSSLYYYIGVYNVDGVDYDGWSEYSIEEDAYATDGNGNPIFVLTERIVYDGVILRGKGVIYRMIDEWGNDCPYDFKNIMFKRGLYADGGGVTTIQGDWDFETYCYTFSWEENQNEIMDASIVGNNGYLLNDEGKISGVYGNIIGVYYDYYGNSYITQQYLNNIVFFSTFGYEGGIFYGCYNNTFGNYCFNNTFGSDCQNNTFGSNFRENTFGDVCHSNIFGNGCYSNTFGNCCFDNTFGINCQNNTFGNSCYTNTFGNSCYNNTFGSGCYDNTFGSNCSRNNFDIYCYNNSLGDGCCNNTFGQTCYNNSLGNLCTYNFMEGDCNDNILGSKCSNIEIENTCSYNKFGDGIGRNFTLETNSSNESYIEIDSDVYDVSDLIDNTYLKLSGGTLAATNNNTPLLIKGTSSANDSWIAFHNNSGYLASVGINSSKSLQFYNGTGSYAVYHSGNTTSLKNPNAIKFKNTSGTEITYDGSSAADLTGGVNYASTAGTATNANNVKVNTHNASGNLPILFTTQNPSTGTTETTSNRVVYVDAEKNKFYYNPNNNQVHAYGGFFETSDERLKDIVNPIEVDLDKLSKLRKVYFNWKDKPGSDLQLGMIAQDVQELYPELVSESEEGQLSLSYEKLSVVALEAIDVLHKENIIISEDVDSLKRENNELKSRIEKLESIIEKIKK